MLTRRIPRIITAIIVALLAIIMAGMASVLHRNTIVDWRWSVLIALVASAAAAFNLKDMMRRLSAIASPAVNYLLSTAFLFCVGIGAFYTINYYGSHSDTGTTVAAEVCRKYKEEHYRTRRLSRGRTVRGSKYYVYYMEVRLPDGRLKPISISAGQYSRLRKGCSIPLTVERGFFGLPVIKNLAPPVDPQPRY